MTATGAGPAPQAGVATHDGGRRPVPALLALVAGGAALTEVALIVSVLARIGSIDHPAVAGAALVVGAVALVPLGAAVRRRDVAALADPVVLAGWAFWLPMFGVGGVALALGWNRPYYLDLLADPGGALLAAQLWALVGFLAFAAGASIPALRRAGRAAGRRLPAGDWPPGALRLPGAALVVTGLAVAAVALATGRLGYDATTDQEVSPLPAYLQLVALVGVALVWFDLLTRPRSGPRRAAVATTVGLGVAAVAGAALAESRAALFTWVLVVVLTTALAGVPVPPRLAVGVLAVAALGLVAGALVASTYREIRAEAAATGAPAPADDGRLADLGTTVERIRDRGSGNVAYVRDRAVQRLEAPGALAVVVARHDELDGVDEAAGAPSVVESSLAAFVPRALWPTKPATSDPGAISRLYFRFERNAFAVTPMGDLLRDLGPIAVPIAMALMGAVLRLVHAALVGGRATAGRVAAWVVLAVRAPMWWEGFYPTYLGDLLRAGAVIAVALAAVHVAVRLRRRGHRPSVGERDRDGATETGAAVGP